MVARGPAGLGFRRDLSGRVVAVAAVLALLGLSAADSGAAGVLIALAAWAGAGWLLWSRRPQTIQVAIRGEGSGTSIAVEGVDDVVRSALSLHARRVDG